jgi:hypothetical protein
VEIWKQNDGQLSEILRPISLTVLNPQPVENDKHLQRQAGLFLKPSVWSYIRLSHAKQNQHYLEIHWMRWISDPENPTHATAVALHNSPVIGSLIIWHVWINWRFLFYVSFVQIRRQEQTGGLREFVLFFLGRLWSSGKWRLISPHGWSQALRESIWLYPDHVFALIFESVFSDISWIAS